MRLKICRWGRWARWKPEKTKTKAAVEEAMGERVRWWKRRKDVREVAKMEAMREKLYTSKGETERSLSGRVVVAVVRKRSE